MDKLKVRLFSDCYYYYNRYSISTFEDCKNEYWLKWKALYELIEETGLVEEYYEMENIFNSFSDKL